MKAEQLMEAIIANAQEGRNLTVRAVRSGTATKEGDRFLLVPVPYRNEFILLYYGELGLNDDELYGAENSCLEYGGFIFTRNRKWYDYRYCVLNCLTDDDFHEIVSEQGCASLDKECKTLFNQRITEYFLNSDDAKKPYNLSNYHKNDVFKLIVAGTDVAEMTLYELVQAKSCEFKLPERINEYRYLEDQDEYMMELVEKGYNANKEKLRHMKVTLEQIIKDYWKLRKNIQHPIWKRAELVRVIPNPKSKIIVTFKIGNCIITEKMKAEPLVGEPRHLLDHDDAETELMEKDLPSNVKAVVQASRKNLKDGCLTLDAIETVSYRKETIYSKQEFMKKLEEGNFPFAQKKEENNNGM